jgi:hypothetical protein
VRAVHEMPPEDLPLRERLPRMRRETVEKLLTWGVAQSGKGLWLMRRSEAYWNKFKPDATDEAFLVTEATAVLDLLSWRVGGTDKQAMEQLGTFEEVANAELSHAADKPKTI